MLIHSIEKVVNPEISEESSGKRIDQVRIIFPLSAYRSPGQKLEVFARVHRNSPSGLDSLKGQLYVKDYRDRQLGLVDMQFEGRDEENCTSFLEKGLIFRGELGIPCNVGGSFFYTVRFSDDDGKTWKYAENESGSEVYRNLIIGPRWFREANVYQIYPRVYKRRDDALGKLPDVKADLQRIKSLNIDTIWLMPIHPVGEVNRKGEPGSPYAVKDYLGIDPNLVEGKPDGKGEELGKQQLRDLIDTAHREVGMKVIFSFVGNHCAPDNVLLDPDNPPEKGGYHPEWFFVDENGKPEPPCADWSDTADLKYGAGINEIGKPKYSKDDDRKAMWSFMISVLRYWVEEFDVDGFRCDFAHWVPLAFWRQAINEIKEIKPSVVFIGEVYERLREHLEVGFDAVYHFELYNQLKSLYHEIRNNDPYFEIPYIPAKIEYENSIYPHGYRLFRYTENHDEIRAAEMYGSARAAKAPTLLIFTLPGVPFIYAGQESGETIRPPLFRGDRGVMDFPQIDFHRDPDLTEWYRKVMRIRKENNALVEGELEFMNSDNKRILAFSRVAGNNRMIIAINFDYTDGNRQWANLKVASNLNIEDNPAKRYRLHDVLNDETYTYQGAELNRALVVGLDQFKSHVFVMTEE